MVKKWNFQGGAGAYMKFPLWWGMDIFWNYTLCTLFAPHILHKLLLLNYLRRSAYYQEKFLTIFCVPFGGQTECIMGN